MVDLSWVEMTEVIVLILPSLPLSFGSQMFPSNGWTASLTPLVVGQLEHEKSSTSSMSFVSSGHAEPPWPTKLRFTAKRELLGRKMYPAPTKIRNCVFYIVFYPTSGLDFTSLHLFLGGCYTCSPWLHIPNSSSSERSRPNTFGVGPHDWGIQHKTRGFRGICHIRGMGLSYPIYRLSLSFIIYLNFCSSLNLSSSTLWMSFHLQELSTNLQHVYFN